MSDHRPPPATLIRRPNKLTAKVGRGGPLTQDMAATADLALQRLSDDFPALALTEIGRVATLLQAARAEPQRWPDALRTIHRIAHDLRGQGGSFGYPLVTRIATSLSLLTEDLTRHDAEVAGVVQAHADALRAVLANRTTGDGDATARHIVQGLELAARKMKR